MAATIAVMMQVQIRPNSRNFLCRESSGRPSRTVRVVADSMARIDLSTLFTSAGLAAAMADEKVPGYSRWTGFMKGFRHRCAT
ncbi:hypothetical protein [Cryobacterium sp. Y57]|uniref:hypothetical protein n=1 Tax=Cryobacterium sp. Y57 TaxID=2048287 RepID=UPI000CE2BA91|nr:hypothetical protein [Cryobacterium sp. Y57]